MVGELGHKLDERNPDFNMAVKSLWALAFVPKENVLEVFLELAESFPGLERVDLNLKYPMSEGEKEDEQYLGKA